MRAVADTNTVVSALLWHGSPHQLFQAINDDHVIACAVAAKANLVVTGDRDLLVLKAYRGIRIVDPAEALRLIRQ